MLMKYKQASQVQPTSECVSKMKTFSCEIALLPKTPCNPGLQTPVSHCVFMAPTQLE